MRSAFKIFLSTPSARRATEQLDAEYQTAKKFLSTPSARRATYAENKAAYQKMISIHALREEGDRRFRRCCGALGVFLSTPSARRATAGGLKREAQGVQFLSTPSARRATAGGLKREAQGVQFLSTPSARRATKMLEEEMAHE